MKKIMVFLLAIMIGLAYMPHVSEARGFGTSRGFSTHTSTFHTRYHSPVVKMPRSTYNRGSSLLSHAASFGLGMMIGHMFHPFGGYYGGHMYGFSLFGLLVDFVIFLLIIMLIKRIFTRRRY
jgi:hypothetical protein